MNCNKLAIFSILVVSIIGCQKSYEDQYDSNPKLPKLSICTCGLKTDKDNHFIESGDIGTITSSVKVQRVQGEFDKKIDIVCYHEWPRRFYEEDFRYSKFCEFNDIQTLWIGEKIHITNEITKEQFTKKYVRNPQEITFGNQRGIRYLDINNDVFYIFDKPYILLSHPIILTEETKQKILGIINQHLEKVKVCERHKHLYKEAWKKYNSENSSQ